MSVIKSILITALTASLAPAAAAQHSIQPSEFGGGNYDVVFEGGALGAYYEFLREADFNFQVIYPSAAESLPVPAFELEGVSPELLYVLPSRLLPGVTLDYHEGERQPGKPSSPHTLFVSVDSQTALRQQLFDLDFEGGTLAEFVAELREVAGANILVREDAEDIEIPPLDLQRATVRNVVFGLQSSMGFRVDFWSSQSDPANVLYIISEGEQPADGPGEETAAWSLAEALSEGTVTAADILGAIEIAQELAGVEVEVRFHQGTQLLIAHGPESGLELVDRIVDEAVLSSEMIEAP